MGAEIKSHGGFSGTEVSFVTMTSLSVLILISASFHSRHSLLEILVSFGLQTPDQKLVMLLV